MQESMIDMFIQGSPSSKPDRGNCCYNLEHETLEQLSGRRAQHFISI